MKHLSLNALHALLSKTRYEGAREDTPTQVKSYERMPFIPLSSMPIMDTLSVLLKKRVSTRISNTPSLKLQDIATILETAAGMHTNTHRPYPSGGSKYPIELYYISFRDAEGIAKGFYHYRPDTHGLELLPIDMTGITSEHILKFSSGYIPPKNQTESVCIFTARWNNSYKKYHEFAFELALIEAGHIAQNILLCAAALELPSYPTAGIHTEAVQRLLGISDEETPVYAVVFPTSKL